MFSTDLKGKYLDSLAHNKNLEEAIKKSENISNKLIPNFQI